MNHISKSTQYIIIQFRHNVFGPSENMIKNWSCDLEVAIRSDTKLKKLTGNQKAQCVLDISLLQDQAADDRVVDNHSLKRIEQIQAD